MLRFYRAAYDKLQALEKKSEKTADDLEEMRRLARVLDADGDREPTLLEAIEKGYAGKWTGSDDPVWDRWLEMVESGDIPEEWYGPQGRTGVEKVVG